MSFQALLSDKAPFRSSKFVLPDAEGQESVLVVAAATFEHEGGGLKLADQQVPVHESDKYYGDPAFSSVRFEADVALMKPYFDILVNGHAHAPNGRPATVVPVQLS